jgi:hypothetical protein
MCYIIFLTDLWKGIPLVGTILLEDGYPAFDRPYLLELGDNGAA